MRAVELGKKEKNYISKLVHGEHKVEKESSALRRYCERLKQYLSDDEKEFRKKEKAVSEKRFNDVKIVFPHEKIFAERDIHLVNKIIEQTKANIGRERVIELGIRGDYVKLSEQGKDVLKNVFSHVTQEEKLDAESLSIELELPQTFKNIIIKINKKVDVLKMQNHALKHGKTGDMSKLIEEEKALDGELRGIVDQVLGIISKEKILGESKRKVLAPIKISHARRDAIIIVIILALAVAPFFSNLLAKETSKVAPQNIDFTNTIVFSSAQIADSSAINLNVKTKTEFLNSLMRLYYYANSRCTQKACVLDDSAISELLGGEKNLENAALKAYVISFQNNILSVKSDNPLSAVLPASMKSATLVIHNTDWDVSENKGNFIFKRVPVYKDGKRIDQARLKLGLLATIGKIFKPIKSMDNIDEAWLVKYQRDDGSIGIYGMLIWRKQDGSIITNGVDLSSEELKTVNLFSYNDMAKLIAA